MAGLGDPCGFGLIDLVPGDGNRLAVIRLDPLVRDTSRPGATDLDERETYLALAVDLLRRAAGQGEAPEDPVRWPIWQALAAHAIHTFDALIAGSNWRDEAAIVASDVAVLVARYQSAQGLYSQAEEAERKVLALRLRVLGADRWDALATRYAIAWMMAARGDHAGAEAE